MGRFTLLMLLAFAVSSAQEAEKKKLFVYEEQWNIYGITSAKFGDNQLADAYGSNIGAGSSLSFFTIAGFRPSVNYEWSVHKITDAGRTGNVGPKSTYTSFFGNISYALKAANKVYVAPEVGIGNAQLRLKPGSYQYGKQTGTQYRIGLTSSYQLSREIALYAGVHYIYTSLKVRTHPDFENYYNQAQQVQFALGLQFGRK
jgi:hypothetical protein